MARVYAAKHPYLEEFVLRPDTALICLQVEWNVVASGLTGTSAVRV